MGGSMKKLFSDEYLEDREKLDTILGCALWIAFIALIGGIVYVIVLCS